MLEHDPQRALITGITGFVGSHLAEFLLQTTSIEVFGLKRWRSPLDNLRSIRNDPSLTLIDGDLTDYESLREAIDESDPDVVFHLGAQSYVDFSYRAPTATLDTNIIGTSNLLGVLCCDKPEAVVHICSSSEVYGDVPPEWIPIDEECPFAPVSPYGVSKVGADLLGSMYAAAYNLDVLISRAFTHSGPRRGPVFFDSNFAKQLVEIERGWSEPVLRVGNLDAVRTVMDVRDLVRAYWKLVNKGEGGEAYNIGGTETYTVKEVAEKLIELSGLDDVQIVVDEDRLRPADVTTQRPDCAKFTALTGWAPTIPYEHTLKDMLEYWRREIIR